MSFEERSFRISNDRSHVNTPEDTRRKAALRADPCARNSSRTIRSCWVLYFSAFEDQQALMISPLEKQVRKKYPFYTHRMMHSRRPESLRREFAFAWLVCFLQMPFRFGPVQDCNLTLELSQDFSALPSRGLEFQFGPDR